MPTTCEPDWKKPQRTGRDSTAQSLRSSGLERADALLLLAHVLQRSREWIVAHREENLSEQQSADFAALCERRRRGEPVAYILGSAGFYGREFYVDRRVLIPRPETEHLVGEAMEFIRRHGNRGRVLDIGTGSGAIACTIAADSSAHVDATDISSDALEVARKNARRLGVIDRVCFHHGDLADPVRDQRFDVIVANLPYVPTADIPQPPDPVSFEPKIALDGGPDGLTHYKKLLPQIQPMLEPKSLLLLEAAPPTIFRLEKLMRSTLPNFAISVAHDYAGLARYIKAVESA